jgi:hypothetical protein
MLLGRLELENALCRVTATIQNSADQPKIPSMWKEEPFFL